MKLAELFAQVEYYLKKGYKLEIQADGETSILASKDYNQRLIARRVSCLRNYLKVWQNGTLKSYLYSGKLTVSNITNQAGDAVAAAPSAFDRRLAEYSPEASRMRKVTIKSIRVQRKKA